MANVGVAAVHGSEVGAGVEPIQGVNQSVVNARDEMVVDDCVSSQGGNVVDSQVEYDDSVVDASMSVLADVVVLLVVAVENNDSCSATGRSNSSSGSFW